MTDERAAPILGPYASAAFTYWDAGWRGILPLPVGTKKPVPVGWTGNLGVWPSYPDISAWSEDRGGGNLALRLPRDVIGIDVDNYDAKPGGAVLSTLESRHGTLPATWRVSSRDDGVSGIRLYRIPAGLRWPGVLGPGIETIRFEHRYVVAWPSLHPNGGTYRWTRPDGAVALTAVPRPDDLPDLPPAWVTALTRDELAAPAGVPAQMSDGATRRWLTERGGGDPTCEVLTAALARGLPSLTRGGSRHDAALALVYQLVALTSEGHRGVTRALDAVLPAFHDAIGHDRSAGEVDDELHRMVAGAVALTEAESPELQPDPCSLPRESLGPLAALRYDGPMLSHPAAARVEVTGVDGEVEVVRTSWWPRDVDALLADDSVEPGPAFLTRADGVALFYPGRINGLLAPAESGKTWVGLLAVVQAAQAGIRSTIIDFEDTHKGTSARLIALGLSESHLREFVAYIAPDERLLVFSDASRDLDEHLEVWSPRLVVLDGVNAAMTLHGFDLISNRDATLFSQMVLHPLVRGGAAVVYIDHTPKDKDDQSSGGIGAQAKRAMTTGCALRLTVEAPFGKGQSGALTMIVDKDRPGDVRGASLPVKAGHLAGTVRLTSHDDETVSIVIEPPGVAVDNRANATLSVKAQDEVTFMTAVSKFVAGAGQEVTVNTIVREVPGRKGAVKAALSELVERGYITVKMGPGNSHLHTSTRLFTASVEDLLGLRNEGESQVGPGGSRWVPDPGARGTGRVGPGIPPPFGGTRPLGTHLGGGGLGGEDEKLGTHLNEAEIPRPVYIVNGVWLDVETGEPVEPREFS